MFFFFFFENSVVIFYVCTKFHPLVCMYENWKFQLFSVFHLYKIHPFDTTLQIKYSATTKNQFKSETVFLSCYGNYMFQPHLHLYRYMFLELNGFLAPSFSPSRVCKYKYVFCIVHVYILNYIVYILHIFMYFSIVVTFGDN